MTGTSVTEGATDEVVLTATLDVTSVENVTVPISITDHYSDFTYNYAGYLDVSTIDTIENYNINDLIIAEDSSIYLATYSYILKVDKNGTSSILAGGGCCDLVDGTGTAASFASIQGLALDNDGNLIVADQGNHAIRKVTPAGVVTTVAGTGSSGYSDGLSNEARFNSPWDVVVDTNNNIYVADYNNNRIRKIDTNGNVTTVAGDGSYGLVDGNVSTSRIGYVEELTVDNNGNILLAHDGFIRTLDSDYELTTTYGIGSSYSQDGNAAEISLGYIRSLINLNGELVYFDGNDYQVRKITADGRLITLAGDGTFGIQDGTPSTAQFKNARGITSSASGDILVLDQDDNDGLFRTISSSAKINVLAGETSGTITFTAEDDEVLLEDNEVVSLTLLDPVNATFGGSATTNFDFTIIDNDSDIPEITFEFLSSIQENDVDSIEVEAVLSNIAGVDVQIDFQINGSATLDVDYELSADSIVIEAGASSASIYIKPIQDTEVEIIEDIILEVLTIDNGTSSLSSLTIDLIDEDEPMITSLVLDGTSTTESTTDSLRLTAVIDSPASFDVEVLLESTPREFRRDFTYAYEGINTVSTLTTELDGPRGLAIDSEGNVFVTTNSAIIKIDQNGTRSLYAGSESSTGTTDSSDPLSARFGNPRSLAFDSQDNLYVVDHGNHNIRKIASDGVVTTLAGSAGSSGDQDGNGTNALFNSPRGITVVDDLLYVADKNNNKIKTVTLDGLVTTFAGTGDQGFLNGTAEEAMFNRPANLIGLADGSIVVADKQNGYLRRIDPSGNVTTYSNYLDRLHGLAINVEGQLIVSSTASYDVGYYLYKLNNGTLEQYIGGTEGFLDGALEEARFRNMSDLAFDNTGSLLIAGLGNNAVRKIDRSLKVRVPAGETTGITSLVAIDDEVFLENDELVTITVDTVLSSTLANGVDETFEITIVDNDSDLPLVVFNFEDSLIEDDPDSLSITATLQNLAGVDVQIDLTLGGTAILDTDYELSSDSIVIDAGTSSASIYLKPIQDSAIEVIESIVLSIDTIYNGNSDLDSFTIELIDDDEPEIVSIDQLGTEITENGADTVKLTATLNAAASFDVEVLLDALPVEHRADYDFDYPGKGEVITIDSQDYDFASGVVVDSQGIIYVTNSTTSAIIQIDQNGNSSIYAGAENEIGSTDSADPLQARFNGPTDIIVDTNDNLYVADFNNHTIRKIAPDGEVTTLAGDPGVSGDQDGEGSNALLSNPQKLAFDRANNQLFITTEHKIKTVSLDGVVTTFAGDSEGYQDGNKEDARFNGPTGLLVLGDGSLLVADRWNGYVRKIDNAGVVTTISEYLWGVSSIVQAQNGDLLVGSPYTNDLLRLNGTSFENLTDGYGYTDGPLESAQFNAINDLSIDDYGSIYILDNGNSAVRKIDNTLRIRVAAGEVSGTTSFVAIDDEIFLEDNELLTVSVDSVVRSSYAGSTDFDITIIDNDSERPEVVFDFEPSLFENDEDSLVLTATLQNIAGVDVNVHFDIMGTAGLDTDFELSADSIFIEEGASTRSIYIKPIQDTEIEVIESILLSIDTIYNGNSDLGSLTIELIDEDEPEIASISQAGTEVIEGGVDTVKLTATINAAASFDVEILLDSSPNENRNDFDFDYPGKGAVVTVDSSGLNQPQGVAVDSQGNIYVANANGNTIIKIDKLGNRSIFAGNTDFSGSTDSTDPLQATFDKPNAIAIDADDNLYVTDHNNHTIRKITPAGEVTTLAGSPGTSGDQDGQGANAQFNNPRGITISDDQILYVADKANNKIRTITLDGTVTTFAGNGNQGYVDGAALSAEFSRPANLIFINDGSLLIADKWNGYIRKIDTDGNVSTVSEYKFQVHGLAQANDGQIYATSTQENYLYKLNGTLFEVVAGGSGYIDGELEDARFGRLSDLTFSNNELLIVDFQNNAIRKIDNSMKISIPAGETEASIALFAFNDNEQESDEEVTITVDTVFRAGYSANDSFSFTILDDEFGFTEVDNSIPGLSNASVSWADFDRDGDKDIAIMGSSNTEGRVLRVYMNDNSVFFDSNQNLTNMSDGDIAWVDINNDGYVDLTSMGISANGIEFLMYLNEEGNSLVANTDHSIEALGDGQMEWGDFDNDGLKDLILTGLDSNNQLVTKLYRNIDGAGNFELDESFQEQGILNGDIRIIDLDLDGDKDLIYTGEDINSNSIGEARMNTLFTDSITNFQLFGNYLLRESSIEFINTDSTTLIFQMGEDGDGDNVFYVGSFVSESWNQTSTYYENNRFTNFFRSSNYTNGDIAIADGNNDGQFDLIVTGEDADGSPQTDIWFSYNGTYELQDFGIRDLRNSNADWIDYDNDGDLDIFISGTDQNGDVSLIYQNGLVSARANQKPSTPSGLSLVDLGNGNVRFEWNRPMDDYSSNLEYNLRIGTEPGEGQILNPASDRVSGDILIQETPLTSNGFYETNLAPGTYYWSVQAVDGGFLGSEFAEEQSFTILYEWKELNLGGIVDRRISGSDNAQLDFFDIDFDDDMDILYVRNGAEAELYLNNSNRFSRFSNLEIFDEVSDATVGDLNNDGLSDLVFALKSGSNYYTKFLFGTDTLDTFDESNSVFDFFEIVEDFDNGLANARMRILDVNNDGTNELVLAGATNEFSSGIPKLYIMGFEKSNNATAASFFIDLSDQIAQLSNATFDFGDIDNDQDIDFIITGFDANEGIRSELYLNETTSEQSEEIAFVATSDELAATIDGTVDLIDFDGDGDLDIIFTGTSRTGADVFELYENRVENDVRSFVNVTIGLERIRESKIDLGDFNGDGYADLLYSGLVEGTGLVTRLSEFDPSSNNYTASDFDVSNILNAEVEFGDLDGDGDLDFMLTGENADNSDNFIFDIYLNVRNESAEASQSSAASSSAMNGALLSATTSFSINEPPTPPTSLAEPTFELLNNGLYEVTLAWGSGNDDTTPTEGLSYSIKIGTEPGLEDIMNSGSNEEGFRRIPGKGNTEHNRGWKIVLSEGAYYWEVQSVDASYNGSEFVQGSAIILGDVENQPPVAEDQTFEMDENPAADFVIGTVEASDPEGGDITFEILNGNDDGAIVLDQATGQLTVANPVFFDFETTPAFSLSMRISDEEAATTDITVTINLIDVDESGNIPPTINDQSFDVEENTANGTLVGTVAYSDSDCCQVVLRVLDGNVDEAFSLEDNGDLMVNNIDALDFETIQQFVLEVEANDLNGGLDTALVTINILDVDEADDETLSVDEPVEIVIYPNPAQDRIIISTSESRFIGDELIMIDISGKIVRRETINSNEQEVDISSLQMGTYFLQIENKSIPIIKK